MALLDQCSWSYPDPTAVSVGQIYTFAVAVPPLIPAGGVGPTVLDVATAATNVWSITDGAGKPLAPGSDYQVLAGGVDKADIAFVVNPSRSASFAVQPVLSIAGGLGFPVEHSVGAGGNWAKQTYIPKPRSTADLQSLITSSIQDAIALSPGATLLEPGATSTLRVVQKALTSVPQIVTNLVHELPEIQIRGAIPLGALVEAVVGPIVGAITSALPSSGDPATGIEGQVAQLLAEPLPIPIAIEVSGRRVTRTLAPLTTDLVTTVTSDLGDPMNLAGTVPVDRYLAAFHLTPGVSTSWTVTSASGAPSAHADLSPGLNLVKTLLLLPDVIPLGAAASSLAPTTVNVTVHLSIDVPQLGLSGPTSVAVDLGPVPLLRLPIVLPQIAAFFIDWIEWMGEGGDGGSALLTTDRLGSNLMPAFDSAKLFLSTLSSVLDTIAKASVIGGVNADPGWSDLLTLGQGVRILTNLLGRLPKDHITFQPVYEGNTMTLQQGWNNSISAVIHIGVPATKKGDEFLRLNDSDAPLFIDFNGMDSQPAFVSIVPNLNIDFQNAKQYPPNTARSNNPGNLDNKLEQVMFLTA